LNAERAQRFIKRCIEEAVSKGHVTAPPDTAKHWALFIFVEHGEFEAMVVRLSAADLAEWSKGKLTVAQIEAHSSKRNLPGSFPVWCAVMEGEQSYCDVTEVRVEPKARAPGQPASWKH